MKTFTYTYNNSKLLATVEHFTEDLYNKFRIYTDKKTFVIDPVNYDKTIWLQSDSVRLPDELIQVIGEGSEAAGILT